MPFFMSKKMVSTFFLDSCLYFGYIVKNVLNCVRFCYETILAFEK